MIFNCTTQIKATCCMNFYAPQSENAWRFWHVQQVHENGAQEQQSSLDVNNLELFIRAITHKNPQTTEQMRLEVTSGDHLMQGPRCLRLHPDGLWLSPGTVSLQVLWGTVCNSPRDSSEPEKPKSGHSMRVSGCYTFFFFFLNEAN